jgi:predicted CXXCH cytochrome family protein
MRCLIRRVSRKSGAGVGRTDHEIQVDAVSIGRATDQDLFLSDLHVALHHAVLRPASDDTFALQARTPSGVQINGRTVQAGVVKVGDRITIGLSTIRLVPPPRGYALALEIEEARAERGHPPGAGPTSLRAAGLGKRRWAWALFLLVAGLGLGVPLAQIHQSPAPAIDMESFQAAAGTDLPWRLAGGDHLWDSGPISRAHRFFAQECRACHRKPFQRVSNDACVACHADQPHHGEDADLLRISGLDRQRCASCHLEHNGTDGLVATESALCTDCHRNPGTTLPESDIQPVSGFGAATHPEFRVRVVSPTAGGDAEFDWRRIRMDRHLREDNGLIFPHDIHLAGDGIESPDGKRVLECASCHRPDASGAAMQPIRFERDCQSCHRLNFEPAEPDRELPHAAPDRILPALQDYYARVALAGGYRDADGDTPAVVQRSRPGAEQLDREERRAALDWADRKAVEVAEEVVEYRTCKTCHELERETEPDAAPRWSIPPVALTAEWYPKARFSHAPHTGMDCTGCHGAEASATSEDVLMPAADTCRDCHGDERSEARVASRCIDCHGFHESDRFTMGARNAMDE